MYLLRQKRLISKVDNMIEIVFITKETCPACIVTKEIISRIIDEYPEVKIVNYDEKLDMDECKEYPHEAVPFLQYKDLTLCGSHKSAEIKEFFEKCLENNK